MSHGKSPCDGIGGTVKRLVATASLQNPVSNQIPSAGAMFKFYQQSINAIKFVNVTVEEMETNLLIDFPQQQLFPGQKASAKLYLCLNQ